MKKAKLILSTIVLTSLSSGFLGSGTVDASEHARNTYNNKVVSLRAASDTALTVSRIPYNPILYFEISMENYNQSDSTQRWVLEYNANAGGYYIREQIPGSVNFTPQYILNGGGGRLLNFSSNKENVGTLWKLYSAGQNSMGNIFFIKNMSNGNYMSWTRGGHTDRALMSSAFDWNREQRFIVQVEGEV
ncbi:hypothetical protein [Enterococcus faecium]|uniref:hypothetical protein n=1 Tax=Enterococcus faecium TaxID=1352 RepID=UPI0023B24EDA|nr:hypothetical protein [Enterococcus faecium]